MINSREMSQIETGMLSGHFWLVLNLRPNTESELVIREISYPTGHKYYLSVLK